MSVTDTKKAPGALFENRNASEGVTDTEKSPGGLFPGVVCEHGTPIFGDCRECAIKRATERRKRYDRAKKAQEAAELCGRCGEDLLPDELVVVVGLGRITLGRWSVPVCAQCAHRKQWKLIYELRGYTYYSDGYYSYAEAPCTNCERLVAHQFLTKPRGKYHFCCSGCRTVFLNRLHSTRRKERNARYRGKTCETCGEAFTAKRVDAKACSPACKQKAYRQRKNSGAP